MKDLTPQELKIFANWYVTTRGEFTSSPQDRELYLRVLEELDVREEIENMDLNDCAGGACKL